MVNKKQYTWNNKLTNMKRLYVC